jgi:hypothetical protein
MTTIRHETKTARSTTASPLVKPEDRGEIVPTIVCAGLIILGVVFRVFRYFADRPLWLDEAALANNIRERSFAGLTRPLAWGQGAPIGFLWLEKSVVTVLGTSELSLRLIPLFAGMLCLPLFYLVCRRLCGVLTANVALALFAVAESFIYYSSEVKQYSTDTLVALALIFLCLEAVRSERNVWLWALGLCGLLGVFLSHSAIFVLGPIVVYLALVEGVRRKALRKAAFVFAVLWGVAFLANYFVFLAALYRPEQNLVESNASGFMPMPPRSLSDCKWYITKFFFVFKYIFSHPTGVGEHTGVGTPIAGLAAALAIVGALSISRDSKLKLVILLGPIALILAASALRKYSFTGRMILFILPSLILLIAAGLTSPEAGRNRRLRLPQIIMFATLYLLTLLSAVNGVVRPPISEEVRPVFAFIDQNRQPGDVVYLYVGADKAFYFYRPRFGLSLMPYVSGQYCMTKATDKPPDLLALRGTKRVWIVFSFMTDRRGTVSQEELVLCLLDSMGQRIDQIAAEGASGYLYDLSDN